jgi:predicted nuclease of predicted toxin-antitoxin system
MSKLLRKKFAVAWSDFSTFVKLALVFILVLAVITIATNITVFNLYSNQLTQSALGKIQKNIELSAHDLNIRGAAIGSTTAQLSKLATFTSDREDFKSIILDSFENEIERHALMQQLTYYPLSDNEIIALSRNTNELIQSFDAQFINRVIAEEKGSLVVSATDQNTGATHLGQLVYNQNNEMIGIIIITRDGNDVFPETENKTKQTKTFRAIVSNTGEYLWKYENYKQRYPNSSNFKEDFPGLHETVLNDGSGATHHNEAILAFSQVSIPFSKFNFVIVEELEFHTILQTTEALKDTLWGMSLGYMGVLGVLFLYTANLIGVEIKISEAVAKEQKKNSN